jgi:hypothetical protein
LTDCASPEGERRDLDLADAAGERLGRLRRLEGPLEMRQHLPAEVGQVRQRPLAAEQQPVKLLLQLLDRARERWLSDVALLSRAREVQRSRHRKKVANLMHFHRATSWHATLSGSAIDPLVANCC